MQDSEEAIQIDRPESNGSGTRNLFGSSWIVERSALFSVVWNCSKN